MQHAGVVSLTTAVVLLFANSMRVQAAPWWDAPALKGQSAAVGAGNGTHYINMDETGTFMICGAGYVEVDDYPLYKVSDLNGATPFLAPAPVWNAVGEDDAWTNGLRGGAISHALGRVLSGTAGGAYKNWNVSLPLSPPLVRDDTVFAIYNDSGVVFDSGDFSPDGLTFYSNSYGSPRNKIWKWNVLDGLASSGTNLTAAASFDTSAARIRSINVYRIDGSDRVFYGEGGSTSGKVYVYDFDTATETLLVTATVAADIMNVKVSGIGLD